MSKPVNSGRPDPRVASTSVQLTMPKPPTRRPLPSLGPRKRRRKGVVITVLAALLLVGCSDSPTGPTVASIDVTAPDSQLRIDETMQLTAVVRDPEGEEIPGAAVAWSSSNEGRATVTSGGQVTGAGVGTVTITAESNGVSGQVQLEVILAPTIESVSPGTLEPGEEATITGQNFSASASGNQVSIHGIRASVLSASETSLTIRLPDFLCRPQGLAPVVVVVGSGSSVAFSHPFRPGAGMELDPGEFQVIQAPEELCLLLDGGSGGAEYLVGAQSASRTASSRTTVRLLGFRGQNLPVATSGSVAGHHGIGEPGSRAREGATSFRQAVQAGSATSTRRAGMSAERRISELRDGSPGAQSADDRWALHRLQEREIRARDARTLQTMLAGVGPGARAAPSQAPVRVSADSQPGDTVQVMVPDIRTDNLCQNGVETTTVVRRVGQRSIWLEDVENPSDGFTSQDFQLLADEYDNRIFDRVASTFGEPTDVDGNDRVVIVVTRQVNEMSANTLGFVVAADFASLLDVSCPGANGGEFYYARAPDPGGSIEDPDGESREYSRNAARSDAPILLAHETTHIIQFGRRFQLPSFDGGQASWLLEGQATLAEEIVGHDYTGNAPRQNLGRSTAFQQGIPTNTSWYVNPFFDLAVYYGAAFDDDDQPFRMTGAPEECGWLNLQEPEPCISGRIAYGVTWSLLRWLSDHFHEEFAGGDDEFQQRIIDSPRSGFATLEDVLERDLRPLMGPWAASHYTDGRVEGGDPLLTFPSWNLRNIEQGLIEEARLVPDRKGFESFEREALVAAGSSLYQLVHTNGSHPPFALSARSGSDASLPGFMQLWVVRIR